MGLKDTMTMQEAQKMKEQLEQVFSVVRLLDGEVLETGEGIEPPCQCYSIWGKSEQCGNCVSRKALQEKRQKTKIEFIDSRVYQVIAKYLNIDGKPYVMEMINSLIRISSTLRTGKIFLQSSVVMRMPSTETR